MVNDIIIGRQREKLELNEAYNSKEAEFIAVFGRRRIGKTFLIRNSFRKKGLYFQITGIKNGLPQQHLNNFAQELGHAFFQGAPISIESISQK